MLVAFELAGGSSMRPPVIHVELFKTAPGDGWEYVGRLGGKIIAASDGDSKHETPGHALQACIQMMKATKGEQQ